MTRTEDRWPAALTRATGEQVRRFRTSAEQLAAEVTAAGLPYTRAQVTNLEAGRRTSITIGELLVLAAVLHVPPLLLLLPIGRHAGVELLPGRVAETWQSVQWLTGERPVPGQMSDDQWRTAANLLGLYRDHASLVDEHSGQTRVDAGRTADQVAAERQRIEQRLRVVRQAIRDRGELPPDLAGGALDHLDDEVAQP
jgi:transcriptional regulator with XRE-family HTH domain